MPFDFKAWLQDMTFKGDEITENADKVSAKKGSLEDIETELNSLNVDSEVFSEAVATTNKDLKQEMDSISENKKGVIQEAKNKFLDIEMQEAKIQALDAQMKSLGIEIASGDVYKEFDKEKSEIKELLNSLDDDIEISSDTHSLEPADFKQENSEERIENLLNYSSSVISQLTDKQKESVRQYTMMAYKNINLVLRGLSDAFVLNYKDVASNIEKALDSSSLPCDCILYRGVDNNALGVLSKFSDKDIVGQIYTDKGYMSTSLRYENCFNNREVILKIHVPKGHKGLYVGSLSAVGDGESEVLLQKDQNMIVTKSETKFGKRFIDLLVLNS